MSPVLADLPAWKVIRVLEAFGFTYQRTKGSPQLYRHADGRACVVPNHATIKRGTLSSILRQAGLTREEFLNAL